MNKMFYKKAKYILAASTIMLAHKGVHAQIAPKYSNEFLAIGVGARAHAMGNAYVSIVDDATAGYWNPAGLTKVQSNIQLGLMHSEYFAGIAKYDYGSIAIPMADQQSTIAATFIRFAVDDIPDTRDLIDKDQNINYDRIYSFSAADYAFQFSYARKNLNYEGLSYGANAKVIYRNVGQYAKAYGFGIDIGAQYETTNWQFGVMARDVSSTFNAWSFNIDKLRTVFAQTGNAIPQNGLEITLPKTILGSAYRNLFFRKVSVLASMDLDLTYDGRRNVVMSTRLVSGDPHLGVEVGYGGFIYLRGGIMNIQQEKDFDGSKHWVYQTNVGVGIRFKQMCLDYAFAALPTAKSVTPASHIISLKLDVYRKGR